MFKAIASADPWGGGGLMIASEGINSQLLLSHEKVIDSVDPAVGGSMIASEDQLSLSREKVITSVDPRGGDQWSPQRGSTVNFHFCMKRQLPLLILGGGLTIGSEGINNQPLLSHEMAIASVDPVGGIDDHLREDQVNFHFHVKRGLPLLILGEGDWWSTQRGSTVNFHFRVEKTIASVDPGGTSVQLLILGGGVHLCAPWDSVRSAGWPLVSHTIWQGNASSF